MTYVAAKPCKPPNTILIFIINIVLQIVEMHDYRLALLRTIIKPSSEVYAYIHSVFVRYL